MTDCRAGGVRNREKERIAREVFAERALHCVYSFRPMGNPPNNDVSCTSRTRRLVVILPAPTPLLGLQQRDANSRRLSPTDDEPKSLAPIFPSSSSTVGGSLSLPLAVETSVCRVCGVSARYLITSGLFPWSPPIEI